MSRNDPPEILIQVQTHYIEEQSAPDKERYVFSYHITITNQGTATAQLIARHWIITDGNGKVEEVKGLGVVGQQPLLAPGQSFEYTSGTLLETPVGTMGGRYRMVTEEGEPYDAAIPEFALAVPRVLH